MSMRRYTVSIDDRSFTIDVVETAADTFEVSVEGQVFEATLRGDRDLPGGAISPEIPSSETRAATPRDAPAPTPSSHIDRRPATPAVAPPRVVAGPVGSAGTAAGVLAAPLPGVVLEVLVAAGAQVSRGDPVLILEAMKMRNTIRSPRDAVVVEVAVAAGQPVGPGDLLVRLGDHPR